MKDRTSGRRGAPPAPAARRNLLQRPEFLYSVALFAGASIAIAHAAERAGSFLPEGNILTAVFFILLGLFTISAGYDHPRVGYVSFDRISQVASLLVLGPVGAAWVNGLASLLFPWLRFRKGRRADRVLTASLNNSGLMGLMVLASGWSYELLGGAVPLLRLDWRAPILLPLLILLMQGINELGMAVHVWLRDGGVPPIFNRFVLALEMCSGVAAVVVAIVFNRLEPAVFALLLVALGVGLVSLRQFARMRIQLEALVEERTALLQQKSLELEEIASRDQLTGIYNRRHAEGYLDMRVQEYYRYRRCFAIALVDLDHFKQINDGHSHDVGDRVLRKVAAILSDRSRETDLVARYGGEEFLLCFPETDAETLTAICDQLRHAILGTDWSGIAPGVRVSMSAGIAEMRPGLDRASLINAADLKLYEAKNAGRNLVLG